MRHPVISREPPKKNKKRSTNLPHTSCTKSWIWNLHQAAPGRGGGGPGVVSCQDLQQQGCDLPRHPLKSDASVYTRASQPHSNPHRESASGFRRFRTELCSLVKQRVSPVLQTWPRSRRKIFPHRGEKKPSHPVFIKNNAVLPTQNAQDPSRACPLALPGSIPSPFNSKRTEEKAKKKNKNKLRVHAVRSFPEIKRSFWMSPWRL